MSKFQKKRILNDSKSGDEPLLNRVRVKEERGARDRVFRMRVAEWTYDCQGSVAKPRALPGESRAASLYLVVYPRKTGVKNTSDRERLRKVEKLSICLKLLLRTVYKKISKAT